MAIDPSIALGVRPIEIANPLAQYGQVAQIQQAQQANQLNALKMQEAQATMEERNALRQLNPNAPDYEQQLFKVNPQLGIAFRKETNTAAAQEATRQKALIDAAAAKQKLLSQAHRDISTRPSDANIMAHTEDIQASDLFSLVEKQKALATQQTLLSMPFEERTTYLSSQGATAGEMKPKYVTQNLGATSRVSAIPAFGGAPSTVSEAPITMTQFEQARMPILQQTANASTTSANAAAANAATAQQRLQQETATGELTPQTLDFAAETYRQTGQMPITGMGKNAASLRTQILNRATELASGMPAAEAAAAVAANKQDIGSRTKAVKDFSTGKQGQQVNAFNTAIDHLGTMSKLTDALQNNDIKAFNALGNTVARQTGQPAPTDFNAAKQIVTAEVIKAVVASGGGVTERQEAERNFADANSPQQLKGIINTYKQLLGGQLNSLNLQYENTTGRKDFNTKLTPEAKNTVAKLRGENTTTGALAPADQEAMNWANANPTDPRAAQIKQKLGR
jgi:hypothetical protein